MGDGSILSRGESDGLYDDSLLAEISGASEDDLSQAFESAKKVSPEWGAASLGARAQILSNAYDIVKVRREEIVDWTWSSGLVRRSAPHTLCILISRLNLFTASTAVGLDREELLAALDQRTYHQHVIDDERRAKDLGITAVPTVLVSRTDEPLDEASVIHGCAALRGHQSSGRVRDEIGIDRVCAGGVLSRKRRPDIRRNQVSR